MPHLLYPEDPDHPIPTFLSIWNQGGDKLIKKQLLQSDHGWDSQPPEDAPRSKSWLALEKSEEHFCLEPKIAIHYFENDTLRYRLADPKGDTEDPLFIKEFTSFTQTANYLEKSGYFPPGTFRLQKSELPQNLPDPITQLDSPPEPLAAARTSDSAIPGGTATQNPEQPAAKSKALDSQDSTGPSQSALTNASNRPQNEEPQAQNQSPNTAPRYPLDLLFHLRHSDANYDTTLHTLNPIIARHPRNQIEAAQDYTLFQNIDPSQPGICLKISYQPAIQFSLNSTPPAPGLPTEFNNHKDLYQLLKQWQAFKPLLPLYTRITSPFSNPGPSGFVLPNTPPTLSTKELSFEHAQLLNHYLAPKSAPQERLIQICLSQRTHRDPALTEQDRLKAFGYTLNLINRAQTSTTALTLKQALTLLSINAISHCPPASQEQQLLYGRITIALRDHSPLNQEAREIIAKHFPSTCQNASFINYVVKVLGIAPQDAKAQNNLVLYACERADSRLLRNLIGHNNNQVTFTPTQIETLSSWILKKAYPDQERATRCLNQLPLSPRLRKKLNAQLQTPRWRTRSLQTKPTPLSI